VQRKVPVGDVLPLPVVLGAVADRDGEACEGRTTLGVAELGIVGDISDESDLVHHYLSSWALLAAPEAVPTPPEQVRAQTTERNRRPSRASTHERAACGCVERVSNRGFCQNGVFGRAEPGSQERPFLNSSSADLGGSSGATR
jgi:hypothetical protein